jgi:hypothetical protein
MNAGVFTFILIAVIAVGINIFMATPAGKKWIKNL